MSWNASWRRVLRAVVVTGLLVLALLGSVLGAIGTRGYPSNFARSPDSRGVAPASPASGAMEYRIGAAPIAPEKSARLSPAATP